MLCRGWSTTEVTVRWLTSTHLHQESPANPKQATNDMHVLEQGKLYIPQKLLIPARLCHVPTAPQSLRLPKYS